MSAFLAPFLISKAASYAKSHPTETGSFSTLDVDSSQAPHGFESVWANNPYATMDYRHTWWQRMLEGLGIRTNFDAVRESMATNAREEQQRILEESRQQEYDSAPAQAQRMRQAGINPDLQGGVDAGSSAGSEPDPNVPISPAESDMSKLYNFANFIFNGFTMAMGFAKDSFALQQMSTAVQTGRTENVNSMFETASKLVSSFLPADYPGIDDLEWTNRESDLIRSVLVGSSYSNKQRDAMMTIVNRLYNSAPKSAEQWTSWKEKLLAQAGYMTASKTKQFSPEQEVMETFAEELASLSDQVAKQEAKNALSRSKAEAASLSNEQVFQNKYDAGSAAEAANAQNELQAQQTTMDKNIDSVMARIIDKLSDKAENGNILAGAVVMVFSIMRMMKFGSSTTAGSTPFGPVNTTTQTFGF